MRSVLLSSCAAVFAAETGAVSGGTRKATERPENATDQALTGGAHNHGEAPAVDKGKDGKLTKAEQALVLVLEHTMEDAEKVEGRTITISIAVLGYIKERGEAHGKKVKDGAKQDNVALSLDMADIRQHCFDLVGYGTDTRPRGSNMSFEQVVGRGIRQALLAFEGHKGIKVANMGKRGMQLAAPSASLFPTVKTLDPVSGKEVGEIANLDHKLIQVPPRMVPELFAEAFPGKKRGTKSKTTATPNNGNKTLKDATDADVFITTRDRLKVMADAATKLDGAMLDLIADINMYADALVELAEEGKPNKAKAA